MLAALAAVAALAWMDRAVLLLVGLAVVLLLVGYLAADAGRVARQPEARHLHAALWSVLGLSLALPSMLMAWSEREL